MDRQINVTLTPGLIRWTLYYQLQFLIILFGFGFLLVAYNLYHFISRGGVVGTEMLLSFLPYLAVPLFFGILLYSAYSKNIALIKKMKTPVVKYRITDEWLHVESDLASGQNSWVVFRGLQKNAKLWRLITQSGAAFIFPVELLDEELKAFLSAKVPKSSRPLNRVLVFVAFWALLTFFFFWFFKSMRH